MARSDGDVLREMSAGSMMRKRLRKDAPPPPPTPPHSPATEPDLNRSALRVRPFRLFCRQLLGSGPVRGYLSHAREAQVQVPTLPFEISFLRTSVPEVSFPSTAVSAEQIVRGTDCSDFHY